MPTEQEELDDLRDLFSSPPRESSLPAGLYARFEVGEENRQKAAQARREREERDAVRQQRAVEQWERTQALNERAKSQAGKSVEQHHERNLDQGAAVRELERMWQQQRQEMKMALQERARAKVREAAGGYASYNERLAAQEASKDQEEREQATANHQVFTLARSRTARRARGDPRFAGALLASLFPASHGT